MSKRGVAVLRDRVSKAIDYAIKENDLTYAELLGMLALISGDLLADAREASDDYEEEVKDGPSI